jgi:hypothetical protein
MALAAPAVGASKYALADPAARQRVDYLVIAGDRFAGRLDTLTAHREKQGHAAGVVSMSAVRRRFESIGAFVAHAAAKWERPAPRFLLLVGDVGAVPTVVRKSSLRGWRSEKDLATDFDYARPGGGRAVLHVGRFPCDNADELDVMIRKTLAYESSLPAGRWQHELNFVAGVGGYGPEIDRLMEGLGMLMMSTAVPAPYDIRAAYGNPRSPYCPYPPAFNRRVVEMLRRGSLLTVYVGHGGLHGAVGLRWRGRRYPIFGEKDVRALRVEHGLPVLLSVACHTGRYDREDCLGEACLKAPGGPVAFVGGSRVTQPYGNALFAKAVVDAFFGKARTLGEVLTQAKAAVLAHRLSLFRLQADGLGAAMQGKRTLEPMRQDVVCHYNLLGDPALVLRKPWPDIDLTVEGETVRVRAPGRERVQLTLECHRLMFRHALPAVDPEARDVEAMMTDRYRKALDKVLARWSVELGEGTGRVGFRRPTQPGTYFFKAWSGGSVGATELVVKPKPAPDAR